MRIVGYDNILYTVSIRHIIKKQIKGSSVKCVDGYNRSLYGLEYRVGCVVATIMLIISMLSLSTIERK